MAEDVARVAAAGSRGTPLAAAGAAGDDAGGARERYALLKATYESRLRGLVGQLKETLLRVQGDAAVTALAADATTAEFVPVRVVRRAAATTHTNTHARTHTRTRTRRGRRAWMRSLTRRCRRSAKPPSRACVKRWRHGKLTCAPYSGT